MTFDTFDRVWFLTWTTYGTWLPGDERGFVSPKFEGDVVEKRNNVIGTEYDSGRPELTQLAQANLIGEPVFLTSEQALTLKSQFEETAKYRGWRIVVGAIMNNHVHLVVGVAGDPKPSYLLRDFKSYGSLALNRQFGKRASGTWWTEQGSKRKVKDFRHYEAVVSYVLRQERPLMVWEDVGRLQGADAPRSPGTPRSPGGEDDA